MSMKIGWSALACIWVVGCGAGPSDGDGSAGGSSSCNGGCERDLWPRLILGISGSTPEAELDVVVLAEGDRSGEREAHRGGCPTSLPARYLCSYGILSSPNDSTMTLTLTLKGSGASEEVVIDLAEYNYCGRQISYLLVEHDGASLIAGEPTLISPCQSIPE
ncbi:hypothetical protein WME95_38485 [Sorangium sp. So ce327]|uniref:hypothetical protein n=1 Tax=Sorangium sp. So ce327 TaxID=3133301 RepID=UPI003F5FDE96